MAKFKIRRNALAKGGIQVGSSGTNVTQILYGSVSACVPALSSSLIGTGSMAISNVPTGAKLFFTGSLTNGVVICAASVDSAGAVTASYVAASGATNASTLTFWYLAVS